MAINNLTICALSTIMAIMLSGCASFLRAFNECNVPEVAEVPQADYHEVVMPWGRPDKAQEICGRVRTEGKQVVGCAQFSPQSCTIYYEKGEMCVRNHERLHCLLGAWHYENTDSPRPSAAKWIKDRRAELSKQSARGQHYN